MIIGSAALERSIILMLLIFLVLSTLNSIILVKGETVESVEILSSDFSDSVEALKHLDITTENYDAGNDGTSREYVDTINGWFVFEGDNRDTASGSDEPIAVVKGYGETDGWGSYADLPYNYSVVVDFMVPSTPGYGNFYVFPRYSSVADKYEVVVDTEWNNIVFNYVKDTKWSNLKTEWFGGNLTIQKDSWYRLIVNVTWEYNASKGFYMNHLIAKVVDLSDTSKWFVSSAWDANLTADTYRGLAFLGFDNDKQFKVYMDNLQIVTSMEKTFVEPAETITPTDLDILSMHVSDDGQAIYFRFSLGSTISADSTSTKYWAAQLDIDKDSRNTENGWDYEYSFIITLGTDGSASLNLYDSAGNWIKSLHILGGGIGYDYLVAEVDKADLSGMGDSLYIYSYTQLGSTVEDTFPVDNSGSRSSDYVIYYVNKPQPSSSWTTVSDVEGDASDSALDISEVGSAYNTDALFLRLSIYGTYPWNGGSTTAIYRVYIDADNDPTTGYSISGTGADYMLEHIIGYSPKLFRYTGSGTDWTWSFEKREDYIYNPGGQQTVVYAIPKSDFTAPSLSSEAVLFGQTGQDGSVVDDTGSIAVPIPEPALLIMIGIMASVALFLFNERI
ncbi:MAG: hypothetical protein DRO10_01105 [Thermoprotei archaeon]|nr:MAG: hypothetical protein DRO10_01105 [Thermoprotei archaeon]